MEQLKNKAGMSSKEKAVLELYDIALSFWIHHGYCFKDAYLHLGLSIEFGFISYHFQCNKLTFPVVK